MRLTIAFLVLIASCTAQAPHSVVCEPAPNRLCPVDEGRSDADFDAFRTRLIHAVHARSKSELSKLVDPHVRTSFGADSGTPNWAALERLLPLGGTFRGSGSDRMFWAPYVYSTWPEAIDAFEHVVAIRAGVPVHASPSVDSTIVRTVDWQILKRAGPAQNGDWLHVADGWVAQGDVYSPVGYRAGFSKSSGQWRLTALVSGD